MLTMLHQSAKKRRSWIELEIGGNEAARLAGRVVVLFEELLTGDLRVGPVIVHPSQVFPATLDDAFRVPRGEVVLLDVFGHEIGIDFVDVLVAHHD